MEENNQVVEEKEIILGAEAVAELREFNSNISVMCAQLGNLERVINKYKTQYFTKGSDFLFKYWVV